MAKKEKLVVGCIFLAVLVLNALPAFAGQFQVGSYTYWIDGVAHTMDVAPFIDEHGRTMVPVRYLAYALGVPEDGVFWRGEDQVVFLNRGDTGLFLVVGEPELLVVPGHEATLLAQLFKLEELIKAQSDEEAKRALEENPELARFLNEINEGDFEAWLKERAELVKMDTVPVLRQGRVFLPARFTAQAFGYEVAWEPEEQKVVLSPRGHTGGTAPTAFGDGGNTSSETAKPEGHAIQADPEQVIAVYRYAGGVLVGVEGKHWFLSVSGYNPAILTITDPDSGEQRQYNPLGTEWRQDPVVLRFGLAPHIEGTIKSLEQEKIRKEHEQWQEWYRQQQLEKLNQELRQKEMERQRQIIEDQRRMEELRRQQELIKPPVTQPYTPPAYTPTLPYTPPAYSPVQPWSPGGRW